VSITIELELNIKFRVGSMKCILLLNSIVM
jgi:hypothetical protein